MEHKQRWQDWVNLILSVWLFLSPFFGFEALTHVASWNSFIFGIAVFVVSVIALITPKIWEEWVNGIIGLWLIASPFIFVFSSHQAAWNVVVIGILIFISAVWAGSARTPRTPLEHAEHAHKA